MSIMFDSHFTFLSGSSEPTPASYSSVSTDISPFTSRCSSPDQRQSQPRTQRDVRYDSYRSSQSSINDLTAQLQSHGLAERNGSIVSDAPSPTFDEADEGYYEGPDTPATSASDSSDFDPTLWDLSLSETGVTSSPRPSLSLEAQAVSSYTMRRRQRQALVRLQCLARRTPDLAMLIEECHPSSLPLSCDAIWTSLSRVGSLSGPSSGRIEKERIPNVRKAPRMRKRSVRSGV